MHSFHKTIDIIETFSGANNVFPKDELDSMGVRTRNTGDSTSVSVDIHEVVTVEDEVTQEETKKTILKETHTVALGQTGVAQLTIEHHLFGITDRTFIPDPEKQRGPDEAASAIEHCAFTGMLRMFRPDRYEAWQTAESAQA